MPPRFSTAALTLAFVALAAFAVFEVRDNQSLRAQLRTEQAGSRPPTGRQRVGPPTPKASSAAKAIVLERIQRSDIPALLDRMIYSGGWQIDTSDELARIDPADLPRVFALLAAYPRSEARRTVQYFLLRRWAATDPRAALAAISNWPANDKEMTRDAIADIWADSDPEAASQVRPTNQSVWRKFALASFENASAAALSQDSVVGRNVAITTVAAEWARKDPVAAWKWTTSLPPELQLLGLQQTVWQMARVNPAAVADYLVAAANNPAIVNPAIANAHVDATSLGRLTQQAADKWAARDPEAAAIWVAGLPPSSDIRRQAELGVVRGWSSTDPAAARQWVESLAPAERVSAAQDFVYAVTRADPATAAAVATQDCDPNSNPAVLTFVAAQWLQSDPAAARAWLAQTALPDATRVELHRRGFKNLPGDPPPTQ